MSILALILFLSIIVPDSPAILQDGQNSNGITVNQDLTNDAQSDYNNGILIVKDSVLQDAETTPATTMTSSTSSSSGGGGGGGGGVTSSENFSNVLASESRDGNLIKDTFVSFKYITIPIYEILVAGKENEYGVTVKVEMLKDKPQKATVTPEGEVIQYFNVVTSTKRMKEAVIRFKLANYSQVNVDVYRLNNSVWEDVRLDELNCYPCNFEIHTDSFSSFAIIKRPITTIPILASAAPKPTTSIQLNTSLLSVQETPKQASGFTLILTIFILLIISRIK